MTNLPLEKQVCSLEPARRLKELGVPQESLFHWGHSIGFTEDNIHFGGESIIKTASAFTVAELGELISFVQSITTAKDGDQWCCLMGGNLQDGHGEFADNEAGARAKMLVYLLENGLIKPEAL